MRAGLTYIKLCMLVRILHGIIYLQYSHYKSTLGLKVLCRDFQRVASIFDKLPVLQGNPNQICQN